MLDNQEEKETIVEEKENIENEVEEVTSESDVEDYEDFDDYEDEIEFASKNWIKMIKNK